MALWKENAAKPAPAPTAPETARPEPAPHRNAPLRRVRAFRPAHRSRAGARCHPGRAATRELKESLIAADLTIEGKIQGTGHVRIAGQFKGDVNVEGDLTIEKGAKLTGGVRANKVTIAGELEGNIEGAQRVELLESGVLTGDLKAGSLTVAAGSRMRGQMEFGWDEKAATRKPSNGKTDGRSQPRLMSAARPGTAGATRTCPHCKATILESASVCPACRGHLRFDEAAAAAREDELLAVAGRRHDHAARRRHGVRVFDGAVDPQRPR